MQVKAMNCPECGNAVAATDQFCPKCFARIERPGWLRRVLAFFRNLSQPGPHTVSFKKTVTIRCISKDGSVRDYNPLAEAPLSVQREVEKLEAEALKETSALLSAEALAKMAAPDQPGLISRKSVSVYRIKDASGKEQIYHSLDEVPPKFREAIEKAQKKI